MLSRVRSTRIGYWNALGLLAAFVLVIQLGNSALAAADRAVNREVDRDRSDWTSARD